MPLVINTNVASLNAQRNLANNNASLDISVQRLSSGLRINSAKDDAAGLAISDRLRAHVRSINVAVRNSQDGISLSQTAEGGLQEIGSILARMRELATQASNGTLSTADSAALDAEFTQLKDEIDRISDVTEFNGAKLLDGTLSAAATSLQVGFRNNPGDQINISLTSAADTTGLNIAGDISTSANARTMLDTLDNAIGAVSSMRGALGAIQNRLESTISNLRISAENLSAADSRIRDADFALETAVFTRNQILVQSATAILSQANSLPQAALQLLQ